MNNKFRIAKMRKITYVFLSLLIIGLAILLAILTSSQGTNIAYADTYNGFIHYAGSSHNFQASVYFPSKVESESAASDFYIRVWSTEIEWSIFGPDFQNVKMTMTRPDGSTKVYSFSNGIKKEHFNMRVFTAADLKDGAGKIIEGIYTVQTSGKIVAGATQDQNKSFSFTVNLYAPTVTADAGGKALSSDEITRSNVIVTATDTNGLSSLHYAYSTGSTYSTNYINFLTGKEFTEEGRYTIRATDIYGRVTVKNFIIDKTAPTLLLTGINDDGFSKNSVSSSWGATVGGVGSQLVHSYNDSLTVKYAFNTESYFPSTATIRYLQGTVLTEAGNYLIEISDKAGNSTSYTFTIDKTAPTLSLSGLTDKFTNDKVTATWSRTMTDISSQLCNSNDELIVKYSCNNTSGTFPTSATLNYVSGTELTEVGNYLIAISDKAGNSTRYTFTIDKVAPTLQLIGITNNGFTNGKVSATWSAAIEGVKGQRSNDNDILTVKYAHTTGSSFPTSATIIYDSGSNLRDAGNYLLTIKDKAGNTTDYRFTIDTTAPILNLSGVASGGFTNSNVSIKWDNTMTDIRSQLSNSNDELIVKYTYSTSGTFPTTASTLYAANTDLSDAGNYIVTITDKAGNFTKYTFTIDRVAPILTLSGVKVNGFTNDIVSATWSTAVDGVRGQRSNNNDILTVKYAYNTGSTFPTSATISYSNDVNFTNAGNYLIMIADRAGNNTSYTFTIDKTAPTLMLSGVAVGGMTNNNVSLKWSTAIEGINGQLCNERDKIAIKYSYLGGFDFPTSANREYFEGNLADEGNYLVTITDLAGNARSYTFTIDKTAPNFVVVAEEYTNKDFSFIAEDLHGVAKLEYRLNGENTREKTGAEITISGVVENCGIWQIRAVDSVGNISSWQKVNLLIRSDFGNMKDARNEYKTATWYTVTLSAKNFPTAMGKYSFENYEAALRFAIQKEWTYRVVTLSNGTWSYSNIANPSVTQIYTKRSELDEAVRKYASANVSTRTAFKPSGGIYSTPTDEHGISRPDALTKQNLTYPDILIKYSDMPLFLISHSYSFRMPDEVLAGNTSSLVLSYISDGITLTNGITKRFSYGSNIKLMLEPENAWKQGYYLVTETDLCGNEEKYIVYLDIDTPAVIAVAESGDGSEHTYTMDAAFIAGYKDAMLFTGLKFDKLMDNVDEYAMIMIDGRGLSEAIYVDGDELPHLKYENGYYGKYTITLYDRSLNALSFVVTIAGAAPAIGHSSLTSETRCRITIDVSDSNNAITSVRFFKVSYTGEYAPMAVDDDGNTINAERLDYSLRNGGKYVIIVTDVFGREIQSPPLFYMKGLPSGTLSGVKENGVTKNTVTFGYENTNNILVYIFSGGQWISGDDRVLIEERSGYNYATIISSEENSYQYKIFLYVANDMNLFVEYIFEIDAIPPTVEILTNEGSIDPETVTRLPFSVNWTEFGITAYYYNKSTTLGELSKSRYTKNTQLTQSGMYVFEVSDAAGNAISFNVTIDNSVSYFIEGNYSVLSDGSYISKNSITLTVTEAVLKWECESTNGITPDNGQKITVDGTYRMHIEDMYGNELNVVIIIDNLPPEPLIQTLTGGELSKGAETNQPFTVTCLEEYVTITYSTDGNTFTIYDGACIDAEGKHFFKLIDRMNNVTTFFVVIDKTVDIEVTGKYIARADGYLAQYITLTISEDYKSFNAVSNNGINVELGKKIVDEGIYTITVEDTAGNVIEIVIEIDLTPPEPLITTETGEIIAMNGKTNTSFTVTCDEPGAELHIAVGSSYAGYTGELLSTPGIYTFRTRDIIGNERIFTIEIDGGVDYEIAGRYVTDAEGRFVSNTWLSLTVLESYSEFLVTSDNGRTFSSGDKITYEGVYVVKISDAVGNQVSVSIVIDMTPPAVLIHTASGVVLQPNCGINEPFCLRSSEELVTLEMSYNGYSYVLYNGDTLNDAALYYFRASDLAGNIAVVTVELDSGVNFEVIGNYKIDGQGRYVSATWLNIVMNEDFDTFTIVSDNGIVLEHGEKISEEGKYHITIIDKANNVVQLDFVIDKTPPKPIIITKTGNEVAANGKTNSAFTVSSAEDSGLIYISTRDGDYSLYDGSSVDLEGKHYFRMVDFIGNSITFTVEIDRTVKYTIKGVYKDIAQHSYATNSGVTLVVDEEYSLFEVDSDDGQAVVPGEKIVREGKYIISITDVVGNVVKINLSVDYTAPIILLSGVDPSGVTGKKVVVNIDEFKAAYYVMYGSSEKIAIDSGKSFVEAGKYTIVAEDFAGNRSSVEFAIDGSVSIKVSPEIGFGQFIKGSVEFRLEETMSSCLLTLNGGDPISFNGGRVSDSGVYTLTVVDMYENSVTYSWTILPDIAQSYNFTIPSGSAVSVLKDGYVISGCVNGNKVELKENGEYELTFSNNGNGNAYTLTVTVDSVKPTVEITQEKNKVIISQPSKDNVTYELMLNGKPINFTMGKAITATGNYVLTVTDAYGNSSVYSFELDYINAWGIAVIVIAVIVVTTLFLTIFISRKRQGVK